MKILLTGSSGFLGKVIDDYLSKNNQVFGLSRSNSSFNFSLENGIFQLGEKFDIVVHAAGKAHINSKYDLGTNSFFLTNVIGTKNLLNSLLKSGKPKSFVFISSVSVYGLDYGVSINEDTYLGAKDLYGVSKIQAEQLVWDWCSKNNVTCTILRLPLVVAFNPPGNLGAMIRGLRNGYYFNIAGGFAKKSMVLASDVAQYVLKASEVGGIFNLTDGYHPSFLELSNCLADQLGKSKPKSLPLLLARLFALGGDLVGKNAPFHTDKLNKVTSTLTFDDSKARVGFGWNPTPVLEGFKIN